MILLCTMPISLWKASGALHNPKGSTSNLCTCDPSWIMTNAVSSLDFKDMATCQYDIHKIKGTSILRACLHPLRGVEIHPS